MSDLCRQMDRAEGDGSRERVSGPDPTPDRYYNFGSVSLHVGFTVRQPAEAHRLFGSFVVIVLLL